MSTNVLGGIELTYGSALAPAGFRRVTAKSGDTVNLNGDRDGPAVSLWANFAPLRASTPSEAVVHLILSSDAVPIPGYRRIPRDVFGGDARAKPQFIDYKSAPTRDAETGPLSSLTFVRDVTQRDEDSEVLLSFASGWHLVGQRLRATVFGTSVAAGGGNGPTKVDWLSSVSEGQDVDVLSASNLWRTARVARVWTLPDAPVTDSEQSTQPTRRVRVTYPGWPARFDEEVDATAAYLAPPHTKSAAIAVPCSQSYARTVRGDSAALYLPPLLVHDTCARLAAVITGQVDPSLARPFLSHDLPLVLTYACVVDYHKGAADLTTQQAQGRGQGQDPVTEDGGVPGADAIAGWGSNDTFSAVTRPIPVRPDNVDGAAARQPGQPAAVGSGEPGTTPWAHLYVGCREEDVTNGDHASASVDSGPVRPGHPCFPGQASLFDSPPPPGPAAVARQLATALATTASPKTHSEYGLLANSLFGMSLAWAAVCLRNHHVPLPYEALYSLRIVFLMEDERSYLFNEKWNVVKPSAHALVHYADGWAGRICNYGASALFVHNINVMHEAGGFAAIVDRLQAHARASEAVADRAAGGTSSSSSAGAGESSSDPSTSPFHTSHASLDEAVSLVELNWRCRFCLNRAYAAHYYGPLRDAILARLAAVSEPQLKKANRQSIDNAREYATVLGRQMVDWFGSVPQGNVAMVSADYGHWAGHYAEPPEPVQLNAYAAPWHFLAQRREELLKYAIVGGPGAIQAHWGNPHETEAQPLPPQMPLLASFESNKVAVACRLLHCEALALRVKGLSDINGMLEALAKDEDTAARQQGQYSYGRAEDTDNPFITRPGHAVALDRDALASLLRRHRVIDLVLLGPGKGQLEAMDALPQPSDHGDADAEVVSAALFGHQTGSSRPALRFTPPHVQLVTRLADTTSFLLRTANAQRTRMVNGRAELAKYIGPVLNGDTSTHTLDTLRDLRGSIDRAGAVVREDAARVLTAPQLVLMWQCWASQPEYDEMRRAVLGLLEECSTFMRTYHYDVLYRLLSSLPLSVYDEGVVEYLREYSVKAMRAWTREVALAVKDRKAGMLLAEAQGETVPHASPTGEGGSLTTGIPWMDAAQADPQDMHKWYGLRLLWRACHEAKADMVDAAAPAASTASAAVPGDASSGLTAPPQLKRVGSQGGTLDVASHGRSPSGTSPSTGPSPRVMACAADALVRVLEDEWKKGPAMVQHYITACCEDLAAPLGHAVLEDPSFYTSRLTTISLLRKLLQGYKSSLAKRALDGLNLAAMPSSKDAQEAKVAAEGQAGMAMIQLIIALQQQYGLLQVLVRDTLAYCAAAVLAARRAGIAVREDVALDVVRGTGTSEGQARAAWASACAAAPRPSRTAPIPFPASSLFLSPSLSRHSHEDNLSARLDMVQWWGDMAYDVAGDGEGQGHRDRWPTSLSLDDVRLLWRSLVDGSLTRDSRDMAMTWLKGMAETAMDTAAENGTLLQVGAKGLTGPEADAVLCCPANEVDSCGGGIVLPVTVCLAVLRDYMGGRRPGSGQAAPRFDVPTSSESTLDLLWLLMRGEGMARGLMNDVPDIHQCLISPVLPASHVLWAIAMHAEDEAVSVRAFDRITELHLGTMLLLEESLDASHEDEDVARAGRDREEACIRELQLAAAKEGLACLARIVPYDPTRPASSQAGPGTLTIPSCTVSRCFLVAMCMGLMGHARAAGREGGEATVLSALGIPGPIDRARVLRRLLSLLSSFLSSVDAWRDIVTSQLSYGPEDGEGQGDKDLPRLKDANVRPDIGIGLHVPSNGQLRLPDEDGAYEDSPALSDKLRDVTASAMATQELKLVFKEPATVPQGNYSYSQYSGYNPGFQQQGQWKTVPATITVRPWLEDVQSVVDKACALRGLHISRVQVSFIVGGAQGQRRVDLTPEDMGLSLTQASIQSLIVTSREHVCEADVAYQPYDRMVRIQEQIRVLCHHRAVHRFKALCDEYGVAGDKDSHYGLDNDDGDDDDEEDEDSSESSEDSEDDEDKAIRQKLRLTARALAVQEADLMFSRLQADLTGRQERLGLPRRTLSDSPAYFEQLFRLLAPDAAGPSSSSSHHSTALVSCAWSLISSLPVSDKLHGEVEGLWDTLVHREDGPQPANPPWATILPSDSPLKLLYMLQVLDKALQASADRCVALAVKTAGKTDKAGGRRSGQADALAQVTSDWGRAFVRTGGLARVAELLMSLDPGTLLDDAPGGQAGLLQACAKAMTGLLRTFLVVQDGGLRTFTHLARVPGTTEEWIPQAVFTVDRPAVVHRMLDWLSHITTAEVPVEVPGAQVRPGTPARPKAKSTVTSPVTSPTRVNGTTPGRLSTPSRTPVRPGRTPVPGSADGGRPGRRTGSPGFKGSASKAASQGHKQGRGEDSDDELGSGLVKGGYSALATSDGAKGKDKGGASPTKSGAAGADDAQSALPEQPSSSREHDQALVSHCMDLLHACLVGAERLCDVTQQSLIFALSSGLDEAEGPTVSPVVRSTLEGYMDVIKQIGLALAEASSGDDSPPPLTNGAGRVPPEPSALAALQSYPQVGQVLATALLCPSDAALRQCVSAGLLKIVHDAIVAQGPAVPPVLPLNGQDEADGVGHGSSESAGPRSPQAAVPPRAPTTPSPSLDLSSLPSPGMSLACWLGDVLLKQAALSYAVPSQAQQYWDTVCLGQDGESLDSTKDSTKKEGKSREARHADSILGMGPDRARAAVDQAFRAGAGKVGQGQGKKGLVSVADKERREEGRRLASIAALAPFPVLDHIQLLCSLVRAHPVVETGADPTSCPRDDVLLYLLSALTLLLAMPGVDGRVKEWVGRPLAGPDDFTPSLAAPLHPSSGGLGLVDELFQVCLFTLPAKAGAEGAPGQEGQGDGHLMSVLGAALPRCKLDSESRHTAMACLAELCRGSLANAARSSTHFLSHHDAEAIGLPPVETVLAGLSPKGSNRKGRKRFNSDSSDTDGAPFGGHLGMGKGRLPITSGSPMGKGSADLILPFRHPLLNKRDVLLGPLRSGSGYAGLRNLGCICYMNSSLQQFFMNPQFRKLVLGYRPPEGMTEQDLADSLPYQLLLLFAQLQESACEAVDPRPLTQAIKDWDGNPTNVLEQKDVPEFLTKLFADWELALQGSALASAPKDVYGGVAVQELLATDPRPPLAGTGGEGGAQDSASSSSRLYRARDEDFFFLQVRIKNCATLADALTSYVSGETVDYKWSLPHREGEAQAGATSGGDGGAGAGAGAAAGPGAGNASSSTNEVTVPTTKRTSLKSCGPHLMIHLSRFDFDLETLQQVKLNDRFEFPRALDMWPYTVWGRPDAVDAKGGEDGEDKAAAPPPRSEFQYELTGVVVHMGTAVGGHYYSFVRERDSEVGPQPGDSWFCFNDNKVTPWEASEDNMDRDCFGGVEAVRSHNKSWGTGYDRPKTANAFCLFYERVRPGSAGAATGQAGVADDVVVKTAQPQVSQTLAASTGVHGAGPVLLRVPPDVRKVQARVLRAIHGGGSEKARRSNRQPLPPAMAAAALEDNTSFWRTYYIFRVMYWRHLKDVTVEAAGEASAMVAQAGAGQGLPGGAYPWHLVRDAPNGPFVLDTATATRLGGPLFPVFRLAASFLLNTMPDGNEHGMKDLGEWGKAVSQMAAACPVGCVWFLSHMATRPQAIVKAVLLDRAEADTIVKGCTPIKTLRRVTLDLIQACLTALWPLEAKGPSDPALAALISGQPRPVAYVPSVTSPGPADVRLGSIAPAMLSMLVSVTMPLVHVHAGKSGPLLHCLSGLAKSCPDWTALCVRAGLVARLVDVLVGYPGSPSAGTNAEGRPVMIQGLVEAPSGYDDQWDQDVEGQGSGVTGQAALPEPQSSSSLASSTSWLDDVDDGPSNALTVPAEYRLPAYSASKGGSTTTGHAGKAANLSLDLAKGSHGDAARKGLDVHMHEGVRSVVLQAVADMARSALPPSGLQDSPFALPRPVGASTIPGRPTGRPTLSRLDVASLCCGPFVQQLVTMLSYCGEAGRGKGEVAHNSVHGLLAHLQWGTAPPAQPSNPNAAPIIQSSPAQSLLPTCLTIVADGMRTGDYESMGPLLRLAGMLGQVGDSPLADQARTDAIMEAIMPAIRAQSPYYRSCEKALATLVWLARDRPAMVEWFRRARAAGRRELHWAVRWLQENERPPVPQYGMGSAGEGPVRLIKPPSGHYGGLSTSAYSPPQPRDPFLLINICRLALGLAPLPYRLDTEDEPDLARGRRIKIADVTGQANVNVRQGGAGHSPRDAQQWGAFAGQPVPRVGRVVGATIDLNSHVPIVFLVQLEPLDATPRAGASPVARPAQPQSSSSLDTRRLPLYSPTCQYRFLPDEGEAFDGEGQEQDYDWRADGEDGDDSGQGQGHDGQDGAGAQGHGHGQGPAQTGGHHSNPRAADPGMPQDWLGPASADEETKEGHTTVGGVVIGPSGRPGFPTAARSGVPIALPPGLPSNRSRGRSPTVAFHVPDPAPLPHGKEHGPGKAAKHDGLKVQVKRTRRKVGTGVVKSGPGRRSPHLSRGLAPLAAAREDDSEDDEDDDSSSRGADDGSSVLEALDDSDDADSGYQRALAASLAHGRPQDGMGVNSASTLDAEDAGQVNPLPNANISSTSVNSNIVPPVAPGYFDAGYGPALPRHTGTLVTGLELGAQQAGSMVTKPMRPMQGLGLPVQYSGPGLRDEDRVLADLSLSLDDDGSSTDGNGQDGYSDDDPYGPLPGLEARRNNNGEDSVAELQRALLESLSPRGTVTTPAVAPVQMPVPGDDTVPDVGRAKASRPLPKPVQATRPVELPVDIGAVRREVAAMNLGPNNNSSASHSPADLSEDVLAARLLTGGLTRDLRADVSRAAQAQVAGRGQHGPGTRGGTGAV